MYVTTVKPYCSNPAKGVKINVNFPFNTSLGAPRKGVLKVSQKNANIKILFLKNVGQNAQVIKTLLTTIKVV